MWGMHDFEAFEGSREATGEVGQWRRQDGAYEHAAACIILFDNMPGPVPLENVWRRDPSGVGSNAAAQGILSGIQWQDRSHDMAYSEEMASAKSQGGGRNG